MDKFEDTRIDVLSSTEIVGRMGSRGRMMEEMVCMKRKESDGMACGVLPVVMCC